MKQSVLESKQQGAKCTFPRRPEKVAKVSGCPVEFPEATATIISFPCMEKCENVQVPSKYDLGSSIWCLACVPACSVTSVTSNSLRSYGLWPARLLCPWDSPGKNTGVGYHDLLQGIFLTQGSNPSPPESFAPQADYLLLSHWGSRWIKMYHQ